MRIAADEGTFAYDRLYPWRMFPDRDEETFSHLHARDGSTVRLCLRQCGAARFAGQVVAPGFVA